LQLEKKECSSCKFPISFPIEVLPNPYPRNYYYAGLGNYSGLEIPDMAYDHELNNHIYIHEPITPYILNAFHYHGQLGQRGNFSGRAAITSDPPDDIPNHSIQSESITIQQTENLPNNFGRHEPIFSSTIWTYGHIDNYFERLISASRPSIRGNFFSGSEMDDQLTHHISSSKLNKIILSKKFKSESQKETKLKTFNTILINVYFISDKCLSFLLPHEIAILDKPD